LSRLGVSTWQFFFTRLTTVTLGNLLKPESHDLLFSSMQTNEGEEAALLFKMSFYSRECTRLCQIIHLINQRVRPSFSPDQSRTLSQLKSLIRTDIRCPNRLFLLVFPNFVTYQIQNSAFTFSDFITRVIQGYDLPFQGISNSIF